MQVLLSDDQDIQSQSDLQIKERFLICFILFFYLKLMLFLLLLALVLSASASNFHTVAIIGTNDLHGGALPTALFRSDTGESYNYGGLEFMAQMIETVQNEYKGSVLYLDAGDQFQGGIEASAMVSSGQIMNDFYNTMGVAGSAIGNHEFDFGPSFLNPYWAGRDSQSPNLAANLRSQKGQQNFLQLQKGQALYQLESGIKIGVIGLSTVETPSTTGAFNDGSFPQYQFMDYAPIVIQRSKRLRQAGANAVIILSHVGNDCNTDNTFGIWDEETAQTSTCSENDEISVLIKALPIGTINGVVQGHRHKFSHHFIRGIPVMGTNNGGFYFNILYLRFYNNQIFEELIEGPIPVCEKIFKNKGTCEYLNSSVLAAAGNLVSWKFHGRTVAKHAALQQIYTSKWLPLMTPFLEPLVKNQIFLTKITDSQNDLGNLITNLMHEAVPDTDVVILNAGGFRTTWVPGIIQYQHFYNMFPFTNIIVSVEMTGQELIDTLTVIQSGTKAFYPTYGLSQLVSLSKATGTRKFISAKLYDGSAIVPTQTYKILTLNFLTQGGDDFKDVIGKVYTVRNEVIHGDFREMIQPKLVDMQIIKADTLVDPLHPRLDVMIV